MGHLFQFFLPIFLLILGFVMGRYLEKRHLSKLAQKETALSGIRVCNLRKFPDQLQSEKSFLVAGSVVIATDYFKVFIAKFRAIFGGEMKMYRSLMDRARREAVVRMLEAAKKDGADSVWNVRFETMTIQGNQKSGGVELLAYGTAVKTVEISSLRN